MLLVRPVPIPILHFTRAFLARGDRYEKRLGATNLSFENCALNLGCSTVSLLSIFKTHELCPSHVNKSMTNNVGEHPVIIAYILTWPL